LVVVEELAWWGLRIKKYTTQKIIAKIKMVIKARIAINKGLFVAQRSESFILKVGLVLGT
jgi:hypothetical protein